MLSEIISRIKNFVVKIKNPNGSNGTGIILDKSGIIVTNSHVVSNTLMVGLETNDDKSFVGRVVKADKKVDFAFIICEQLKVDEKPVLSNREDIIEGEDVVAIGHPYGYDFTVTKGIVSSSSREINGVKYIQTDVPINPGNSGGPLLDHNGEIVGINTWVVSNAQGLSFAVPATYISEAYKELPCRDVLLSGFFCTSCGHIEAEDVKYCSACGDTITKKLECQDEIFEDTGCCHECLTQNASDETYCQKCGVKLIKKAEKKPQSEAVTVSNDQAVKCKSCGQENTGQKYCKKCGHDLSDCVTK